MPRVMPRVMVRLRFGLHTRNSCLADLLPGKCDCQPMQVPYSAVQSVGTTGGHTMRLQLVSEPHAWLLPAGGSCCQAPTPVGVHAAAAAWPSASAAHACDQAPRPPAWLCCAPHTGSAGGAEPLMAAGVQLATNGALEAALASIMHDMQDGATEHGLHAHGHGGDGHATMVNLNPPARLWPVPEPPAPRPGVDGEHRPGTLVLDLSARQAKRPPDGVSDSALGLSLSDTIQAGKLAPLAGLAQGSVPVGVNYLGNPQPQHSQQVGEQGLAAQSAQLSSCMHSAGEQAMACKMRPCMHESMLMLSCMH